MLAISHKIAIFGYVVINLKYKPTESMKNTLTIFLFLAIFCVGKAQQNELAPPSISPSNSQTPFNQLVWSDEFEGEGAINTSKWFHQTQLPEGGSWYNGEIQHYTNRTANAFVENGQLTIRAKRENFFNQGHLKEFTSARLNSKFAFTYGRVEVRAKLPTGVGTWPAIWTLGKNISESGAYWQTQGFGNTGWPACGEIDIMEHWGHNQNFVQSATHTPSSFGNTINHGGRNLPTASTDFHLYALEWYADRLVFSVDDVVHFTYQPSVRNASTWPFDAEQYLLLNFAIQPSIAPSFQSGDLVIDYVRVFQEGSVATTEPDLSSRIQVSPNPFRDQLTVSLDFPLTQATQASLYDSSGRLVRQFTVQSAQFTLPSLSYLPSGTYFLRLPIDTSTYNIAVVKE